MTVSTRYKMLGFTAGAALIVAMGASWATPPSSHGSYGNRSGSGSTTVNGPRVSGPRTVVNGPMIGGPKVNVGGPMISGPKINVGGPMIGKPSININGPVITGPQTFNLNTVVGGGATGGTTTFVAAGGSFFASTPNAVTSIDGLSVSGGEEIYTETVTEQVPVTRETCVENVQLVETVRPVRAVCIDDRNIPHPASQLNGEQSVSANYSGEVFRCIAGTYMQVTLGSLENGQPGWNNAQSFSCQKGDALVHRPGGGLTCAPQRPQRDCNERSLLRRFQTGIKLVRATEQKSTCTPGTETVYETVTREVQRRRETTATGNLVLDGGVGQGIH